MQDNQDFASAASAQPQADGSSAVDRDASSSEPAVAGGPSSLPAAHQDAHSYAQDPQPFIEDNHYDDATWAQAINGEEDAEAAMANPGAALWPPHLFSSAPPEPAAIAAQAEAAYPQPAWEGGPLPAVPGFDASHGHHGALAQGDFLDFANQLDNQYGLEGQQEWFQDLAQAQQGLFLDAPVLPAFPGAASPGQHGQYTAVDQMGLSHAFGEMGGIQLESMQPGNAPGLEYDNQLGNAPSLEYDDIPQGWDGAKGKGKAVDADNDIGICEPVVAYLFGNEPQQEDPTRFVFGSDRPLIQRQTFHLLLPFSQDGEPRGGKCTLDRISPAQPVSTTPIVFIHGDYHTGSTWVDKPDFSESWADYFVKSGHTVIVPDLPLSGRSMPTVPDSFPKDRGAYLKPQIVEAELTAPEKNSILLYDSAGLHSQFPGHSAETTGLAGDPIWDQYFASLVPVYGHRAFRRRLGAEAVGHILKGVNTPVVLVAEGSGCEVAWLAADRLPHLVAGVVSICPLAAPFCYPFKTVASDTVSARLFTRDSMLWNQHLVWGVSELPLEFDPPVDQDSPLRAERVVAGPFGASCALQQDASQADDAYPVRRLKNLAGIPQVLVTPEAGANASYDWATVQFLRQAGVGVEWLELAKHGHQGNGRLLWLENNSSAIVGLVKAWVDKTLDPANAAAAAALVPAQDDIEEAGRRARAVSGLADEAETSIRDMIEAGSRYVAERGLGRDALRAHTKWAEHGFRIFEVPEEADDDDEPRAAEPSPPSPASPVAGPSRSHGPPSPSPSPAGSSVVVVSTTSDAAKAANAAADAADAADAANVAAANAAAAADVTTAGAVAANAAASSKKRKRGKWTNVMDAASSESEAGDDSGSEYEDRPKKQGRGAGRKTASGKRARGSSARSGRSGR